MAGKFSIIDLIIYIVLIGAVVLGFIFGFKKKRLTSFAFQVGFVAAYFLGGPLANLLTKTDFSHMIQTSFFSVLPTTEAFSQPIAADVSSRNAQYTTALNEVHIPSFFQGFFVSHVTDTTTTVGTALASSFAYLSIIAGVYLILFLLAFILVRLILGPLWKEGSLFGEEGKTFVGRLAGAIRMVVKATMTIFTLLIIITVVSNLLVRSGNLALYNWIRSDLNYGNSEGFSIGRLFYNTVDSFLGWIATSGMTNDMIREILAPSSSSATSLIQGMTSIYKGL